MMSYCMLCPRGCKVDRSLGEKGFCGADSSIKIARSALHFWEEPCISGTKGSGTVFFSGCNMKCIYCQNYGISTLGRGAEVTEQELAGEFISLQEQGAHNINLVTPTHYVPGIMNALDIARGRGLCIPVAYNCGGYESVETIERLSGYVSIYMPDIKYFSDKYAVEYSKAPNYFEYATKALDAMVSQAGEPVLDDDGIMQSGVIVRHLMLPGMLFDTKKIMDYLSTNYGDSIYISLMSQYTPMPAAACHKKLCHRINEAHYESMVDYIEYLGLKNVFIQDISSSGEEYIPPFSQELHQETS